MNIDDLKQKPIWQMSGEEFLFLQNNPLQIKLQSSENRSETNRYVYGIEGIATLLGCSKTTANRIKKSKKLEAAITQIGRKIITDADLALKLAGPKTGGRK